MLRFLEVVFLVTMSSLGIVDREEISSLVSSRFIKALTTRALATFCNMNAVRMYLMKPILASRCVFYLYCVNQVLFFYSMVMILSSPYFIDDMVPVESITWRTKKRGNRALQSLMMVNFAAWSVPMGNSVVCCMTVSSSVIIFAEGSRSLMAAKRLRCFDAMFTMLPESLEPNSTFTRVMYRLFSYLTAAACATSRL